MAVAYVAKRTCDRCPRTIEESVAMPPVPGSKDTDPGKPTLFVEANGFDIAPITFRDLCTVCHDRVKNLVEQIGLIKNSTTEVEPGPQPPPENGAGEKPDNKIPGKGNKKGDK